MCDDGQCDTRIEKATSDGGYRKLIQLDPFVGGRAQAGQKMQAWMRTLTERGQTT